MVLSLRARLIFAVVVPLLIPIIVAFLKVPPLILAAILVATGAASVTLIIWMTKSFEKLRRKATDSLLRSGIVGERDISLQSRLPDDGSRDIERALAILLDAYSTTRDQLNTRNKQFEGSLLQAAFHLNQLAKDGKLSGKGYQPDSPWLDKNHAVQQAFVALSQSLQNLQRRVSTLLSVIQDVPDPIVVSDPKLNVQFINGAAEKLFAGMIENGMKVSLRKLFTDQAPTESLQVDMAPYAKVNEVTHWIENGRGGVCESLANCGDVYGTPVQVSILPMAARKNNQALVLLLRDMTNIKRAELNTRQLHRRLIGQRMSLMIAKESSNSLDVIRTQASLLSQAAKQTGQREKFLPKVNRIVEEVNRHELTIQLLGWLGRLTTTQAAEPDTSELRLRTIVEEISDKLNSTFNERGNRLELTGDAGWIMADDSRIAILVTGLLVHANNCVEQNTIRVELFRRSMISSSDELSEIAVNYPAERMTQAVIDDLKDPFRRINSAVFDTSLKTGFLLGPAVACRVSALMGGELIFDHDSQNMILRAVLPTRDRSDNRAAAHAQAAAVGTFVPGADNHETLTDWRIGGKESPGYIEEEPDLTTTPTDTRTPEPTGGKNEPVDESLGSFFG